MASRDLNWIKADRSMSTNACVEMAADGSDIVLRNSRDPDVDLRYSYAEIEAFFDGVKAGEFDHLLDG